MKNGDKAVEEYEKQITEMRQQITKLKALEDRHEQMMETLRQSESKFRNLADQSPNMIFINKEGRVVYANQQCKEITGYKKEELCAPDFNFMILTAPESVEVVQSAYASNLKGEYVPAYEYTLLTKDGRRIDTMLNTKSIEYEGGNAVLGTLIDITEKKMEKAALMEAQEKLFNAEKLAAIGQLASGVAHQLRNPLGVINNAAYFIRLKFGGIDEKLNRYTDLIKEETEKAAAVINGILDFARMRQPDKKTTNINALITKSIKSANIHSSIEVIIECDERLPEMPLDTVQIAQVLINIIANAIQSMPKGGTLSAYSRQLDGYVEVEINDTGCGISDEEIGRIFDPLFTTKGDKGGTGIGLTLCDAIVRAHKGSIDVISKVDQGTSFTIKLPITTG